MSDTKLSKLVINELTKAQYEAITPEQNQLYLVTDDEGGSGITEVAHDSTLTGDGTPVSLLGISSTYHDSTKQDSITSSNKLSASLISNDSSHRFVSDSEKTTWSNKQDSISDLSTIRSNAQAGKDIIPQVNANTQKIEELVVARFPNAIIIGTPHIEGGQVSGFTSSNYLQFPFIDISRGLPFDIYFSFTTTQDVQTQQNVLDAYFGIALAIQNGKGVMALSSNGSSWDIGTAVGTNTLLPNTTYYVKYSWTGTKYSAALSTDESSYVPDMNLNSTLSPHKTTIYIGGSPNIFGAGSAHPFKGTINFNKSKVVVNGITVWEGMADVGLASRANVSLSNLDVAGEARFNSKQDLITDLSAIRTGAGLGATALQSISSSDVTTALGFTPYNASNPAGYITSSYHDSTKQDGFIATYGTTTYDEISEAASANKDIVCFYGTYVYRYAYTTSSYHYLTCQATTTALRYIRVTPANVWSASSTTAQTTGNIISTTSTKASTDATYYSSLKTDALLESKQDNLVSGTNIKTINGNSLLGSGDLTVEADMANSVKDQNHTTVGIKTWTGTLAEYNAIATKDANTIYNVVDDNDVSLDILKTIYPVGSLYLTTNTTCPLANLFGTWALVSQDRVLQGAGSRGAVGTTVDESLPNLQGTIGGGAWSAFSKNSCTGVFKVTDSGKGYPNGGTPSTNYGAPALFDASFYSSTYQDNAPVQQNAYLINVFQRIS